jgi:hypothetical protein
MTSKPIVALAAILSPVLMLGSLTLATGAFARDNGRRGGGDHVAAVHVGAGHGPGAHFAAGHPSARVLPGHGPGAHIMAGHSGRAFVSGGHRRRFWHDRWWDYGVGPCWAWSDVTGEYVWVCD